MRAWCVKVPREKGETVRKKLSDRGLLAKELRIRSEGDYLLIPVRSAEIQVDGCEILEEEFEESKSLTRDFRDLLDLPENLMELVPSSYDVVGEIAIIRLPDELLSFAGVIGDAIRRTFPRLRTVALNRGVRGEFRVMDLRVVSGEESLVTVHTEFGLRFKVDLGKVYFNPRLAGERYRVARLVRPGEVVIDMFAGAGPFALMVARTEATSKVYAIDINPEAIALLKENMVLNRVSNVEPVLGDAREVIVNLPKADRIIMNLPHSAHEFLPDAVRALKTGGKIHFYILSERERIDDLIEGLLKDMKERGFHLEVISLNELKTYSPSASVYAVDLMLGDHRSSRG